MTDTATRTAYLSTNTTGTLRKLNKDDLDALVDVPLVDGTVLEMPGHQAVAAFNEIAGSAIERAVQRHDLKAEILASIPNIVPSYEVYEIHDKVVTMLRTIKPDAADEALSNEANQYLAGRLLRIDEIQDREEYQPLVLTPRGALVTASVENCARCKKNPSAEFRDLSSNALDYKSDARLASADQEYVCGDCSK